MATRLQYSFRSSVHQTVSALHNSKRRKENPVNETIRSRQLGERNLQVNQRQ